MCYLKTIDTFLKDNICILKMSKELKNGIEILVVQAVYKLRVKTVKILFWSIMKNRLAYLNFDAIF